MPEVAVGLHVNAVTPLCKRTDSSRDQSQRGAAVAAIATVKACGADWSRAPRGRDGRLSEPIGEEQEESRNELENEVTAWVGDAGHRTGVSGKLSGGESSVSDQPGAL